MQNVTKSKWWQTMILKTIAMVLIGFIVSA